MGCLTQMQTNSNARNFDYYKQNNERDGEKKGGNIWCVFPVLADSRAAQKIFLIS